MIPIKLTNDTWPPKDGEFCSSIVLYYDNWNDYSYRTSFVMCYGIGKTVKAWQISC